MFVLKIKVCQQIINSRNLQTFSKCLTNQSKLNVSDNRLNSRQQLSPQHYCLDCVKRYDFEGYLATTLIKDSAVRRSAFAVKSFNAQLSHVRDMTSTDLMAQMRLQYWSELIDDIFSGRSPMTAEDTNEPIACELNHLAIKTKTSKYWFKKLIESRMNPKSLSSFPFETLKELEKYGDSSVTPVYYIIVECLTAFGKVSANERLNYDHICSHLGRAQVIVNVLRGITHNARYNRCYIPTDLLVKHKTTHEDFLRGNPTDNLLELSYDLASVANQHLDVIRKLLQQIDRQNRLIFLPIVANENYLKRLQKINFNIFNEKLRQRNGFLPFILWYYSKRL
ncbi:NADH dehydrogenase (ubiquinone) complex I, assembly factor 6-like [Oppia nitens]|uniref:NADH dehydrogenase (ubiquinone) complex I, assembly factor 6-like n=1 Tax=Oppia nitens TaxID=1686743 RepID=UPI0023DCB8D3|nr:NADH dehydrogenase (ubiquinone) complex I, assembly factor 6-like [Oppia nitens]